MLALKSYTHDLSQLLKVAGLGEEYKQRATTDTEFELKMERGKVLERGRTLRALGWSLPYYRAAEIQNS